LVIFPVAAKAVCAAVLPAPPNGKMYGTMMADIIYSGYIMCLAKGSIHGIF